MSAGRFTAPVLVIADAAPASGLGHLARCEAVAQAMRELGVHCMRYAFGSCDWPAWTCVPSIDQLPRDSAALLLVDSYMLDGYSLRAFLSAERVVAFHDVGPVPGWADLVVSTEIDAPSNDGRVIGGFDHLCLGTAYWHQPPGRDTPTVVRTIVVTTGGGDPGLTRCRSRWLQRRRCRRRE